jgi:ATP-dependent DNA helicase HFM1/MER3
VSHSQKRYLILQIELGGVEIPVNENFNKHRRQYQQDKNLLFAHYQRLLRCIADCQVHLGDALATENALELCRSVGAKVWDNSPWQMKQIPGIGPVAIRKLVSAGINSIDILKATEPAKINSLLSKQGVAGQRILNVLETFPKLRVSLSLMGKVRIPGLMYQYLTNAC